MKQFIEGNPPKLIGCFLMPSVGVLCIPYVYDFFLAGIGVHKFNCTFCYGGYVNCNGGCTLFFASIFGCSTWRQYTQSLGEIIFCTWGGWNISYFPMKESINSYMNLLKCLRTFNAIFSYGMSSQYFVLLHVLVCNWMFVWSHHILGLICLYMWNYFLLMVSVGLCSPCLQFFSICWWLFWNDPLDQPHPTTWWTLLIWLQSMQESLGILNLVDETSLCSFHKRNLM